MIQISYNGNKFIVEKMTEKDKAKLKADKPEIYAKFFPETEK